MLFIPEDLTATGAGPGLSDTTGRRGGRETLTQKRNSLLSRARIYSRHATGLSTRKRHLPLGRVRKARGEALREVFARNDSSASFYNFLALVRRKKNPGRKSFLAKARKMRARKCT